VPNFVRKYAGTERATLWFCAFFSASCRQRGSQQGSRPIEASGKARQDPPSSIRRIISAGTELLPLLDIQAWRLGFARVDDCQSGTCPKIPAVLEGLFYCRQSTSLSGDVESEATSMKEHPTTLIGPLTSASLQNHPRGDLRQSRRKESRRNIRTKSRLRRLFAISFAEAKIQHRFATHREPSQWYKLSE